MFETREELLEQIKLGEDGRLECKEMVFAGQKVKGPARDDVADELAAFANAKGGVMVFGVNDKTHEIVGIPEDKLDLAERFVQELCHDSIKPALLAGIRKMRLPGKDGATVPVIRVDVESSLFVHESPRGYFYRVGSAKRRMSPDWLARMMQQRSQARLIRFDEQTVPGATVEDFDGELVKRFKTPRTKDAPEVLLRKLGLARPDVSGVLKPTVAGVLMATRAPETWMPSAYIQAVAYRGEGARGGGSLIGYQLDARDIVGPLDRQVAEACRFVARNMRVGASKTVGRHDVPQYDMAAVFEALVNAVAHRDYSIHGARIRLHLYGDRLELYSPGALPNTMTVDEIQFRQAARNESISTLLARCRVPEEIPGLKTSRKTLMDRRGEGVDVIFRNTRRLSGKDATFRMLDDAELLTIIPAATAGGTEPKPRTARGRA